MDRKEDNMRVVPVKKEEVKLLAANQLSKEKIDKLFRMFCIYTIEYEAGAIYAENGDCSKCILCEIPWVNYPKNKSRDLPKDLCFAIWHEGVLKNA